MKKILLSAVAVLAFSFANAQEIVSSKGENYLPKQGDWSIGFNANSALELVGNAFNNSVNKTVAFDSNSGAQLPGFDKSVSFVGKNFTSDTTADRYTANLLFAFEKQKDVDATNSFGLLAGYGKEWRKGTTRLQGFYGADALIGFGSPAKKNTQFLLGVQGFAGAEYFVFPKVALGAQYSYGVFFKYKSVNDASTVNFELGSPNKGFGTASVLLNLYF